MCLTVMEGGGKSVSNELQQQSRTLCFYLPSLPWGGEQGAEKHIDKKK